MRTHPLPPFRKTISYSSLKEIISQSDLYLVNLSSTRMVVHGQLVERAVCLSDLYDVFPLDIVRDTRQNLWTMIYRSQ